MKNNKISAIIKDFVKSFNLKTAIHESETKLQAALKFYIKCLCDYRIDVVGSYCLVIFLWCNENTK